MEGKISGVRYGIVISTEDETGADRIKVQLLPEDRSLTEGNEDTMFAIPLMPKFLHIKPKVNEGVLIILATANDGNSYRYYIGPVISQLHRMFFENGFNSADAYQRGARRDYDPNPNVGDAVGAFPDDDDISIMGRKNCDIQIKDDDIRIRAGVKVVDDASNYKIVFNRTNPAYIKLKYHEEPIAGNKSTATIVADKINLLSNKSNTLRLDNTDEKDLITDEKIKKILEEGYKLPYGERLVELLKMMIDVFCTHTHNFIGLPPNAVSVARITEGSSEDLVQGKLLSDTVRIN